MIRKKTLNNQLIIMLIVWVGFFPLELKASLTSANLLMQETQELRNQKHSHMLIFVQNSILEDIIQTKKGIETIRLSLQQAEVVDTSRSWIELRKKLLALSFLMDEQINNLLEQQHAGYDITKISSIAERLLTSESKYLYADIKKMKRTISNLKADGSIFDADKLFKYLLVLESRRGRFEDLLAALESNVKRMDLIGFSSEDDRAYINKLLTDFSIQQMEQVDPTVIKYHSILQNIQISKLAIQEQRKTHRTTIGEERLIAWVLLRQELIKLSELLDNLVSNYQQQKIKGLNIDDTESLIIKLITSESNYIRHDIKEGIEAITKLKKDANYSDKKDLYIFQVAMGKQQVNIETFFQSLVNNIKRMELVGIDADMDISYLHKLLTQLAKKSVARIQLVTEEQKMLEQRIKVLEGAESDVKDELKMELLVVEIRKEQVTAGLSKIINIMNQQDIDSTKYIALLIEETGNISQDFFDLKVGKSIFNHWLKFAINWLHEYGSWFVFKMLFLIFILLVSMFFSNMVGKMVDKATGTSRISLSSLLKVFFISASKKLVMLIGIIFALSQMGLEITPVLTGLGIVGFIIGFAMQDTLSNFVSGIMILVYRPYDIDDFVEVSGIYGQVKHMNLVSTTILTPNNRRLMLPNNKIWGDTINNATAEYVRRIDLEFGISYTDDIALAEQVLYQLLDDHEQVLKHPEPLVKVHRLGESSVEFIVRPWVKTDDYWNVHWDITRQVKEKFDAANITIPFPQRDMHLHL